MVTPQDVTHISVILLGSSIFGSSHISNGFDLSWRPWGIGWWAAGRWHHRQSRTNGWRWPAAVTLAGSGQYTSGVGSPRCVYVYMLQILPWRRVHTGRESATRALSFTLDLYLYLYLCQCTRDLLLSFCLLIPILCSCGVLIVKKWLSNLHFYLFISCSWVCMCA